MQVPIKVKPIRKCDRCGLMYPKSEEACSHCEGLSDREVSALQEEYESYHEGNANLGKLLLYFAALAFVGTLVLWLGR